MNILANYLRKQTIKTSMVVLLLLFLLMIGTLFTSTLRTIARGILPPELLFLELSLRSVDVLTILIPLSFYLGVLVSLSQMYRNQEAVMMHASGWSVKDVLRALSPLMWLVFVLMLVVSLVISPQAARLSKELTTQANENISLMGLTEGKFQKFFSSEGVIFVEKIDAEKQRVENIFANIYHPERIDTLTAEYGYQFEENGRKYVALFNGYRNEGRPGSNAYRMMQFERNDIMLPDLDQEIADLDEMSKTTIELMRSNDLRERAQLQWRLSPAFSVLVLFMLAVSLAKTSHREAKFINLVLGILAYIFMVNLLTIGHSMLEQGKLPIKLGLWWVYLIVGGYAVWRIRRLDGPKVSAKLMRKGSKTTVKKT